ncbi:DUF927 domain-containing protein [Methanococcoides alaskense]|uniref:Uncharacterized protein (DUF927 family) n=1 Tax=Methanococcoides alaskense TaxID=325778 RepID=A0AA90U1U3_9EURY|nr:DUF927 domain-containing protein [Methanococcoides alaskense]MDA0524218.1 DUF927 domain-containing protein [Methanococcoides alaskense]MDR6223659.1 uncharacterized protein (DUF927 family) [Methanococcoides alaskense]
MNDGHVSKTETTKEEGKSFEVDIIVESTDENALTHLDYSPKSQIYAGKLLPSDYLTTDFEGKETGLFKIKYNKKSGNFTSRISHSPCTITGMGMNIDDGNKWLEITFAERLRDECKILRMPQVKALSNDGIKELINKGFIITLKFIPDLNEYLAECLKFNYDELDKIIVAQKNGWKPKTKIIDECFVFGDRAYTKDSTHLVEMVEGAALKGLTKKGTFENWIKGMNGILSEPIVRFKIYAAMSAMILNLVGVDSFFVDDSGESSTGKTTTSSVAFSAIGNPKDLKWSADTTVVGAEKMAELFCDLPFYLDETSVQKNQDMLTALIYMISNGKGKLRGKKEGGLLIGGSWNSVVLTTGEKAITDNDGFTGQLVRVIELHCDMRYLPDEVELAKRTMQDNYGHLVEPFIKKIFDYKDNIRDETFSDLKNQFTKTNTSVGDRLSNTFAAITTAGVLIEEIFEEIGVETVDPFAITNKYFEEIVENAPIESYSHRALQSVYDWIQVNIKNFVDSRSNRPDLSLGQKQLHSGWISDEYIDLIPLELRRAIRESGYNSTTVQKEWADEGILVHRKENKKDGSVTRRFSTKVKYDGTQQDVSRLNLKKVHEILGLKSMEPTWPTIKVPKED